jgi:hypothetical protein
MFPIGAPGFALLLLRVAVAVNTLLNTRPIDLYKPGLPLIGVGLTGAALCLGAFTPLFAFLSLSAQIASWFWIGGHLEMRLLGLLITSALFLLGPGAYSFDGRWFGRELLSIPLD